MSFFIHFKTEFDAIVEINTLEPILLNKNNVSTLSIEVTEQYPLVLKVSPINEKYEHKKLLPYAAKLNIQNGLVEKTSELLQITEYPYNHYEVTFLKNCVAEHVMPKVLAQHTYFIKGKEHTATVFFDGIYQLSIQEKELMFSAEISHQIEHITIEKIKNKDVVMLQAKTKHNENYTLILTYKNNSYQVLVEDIIEKVEHNDDLLTTLKKQNDMAGHGVVSEFELRTDSVIKKDEYVVYMSEKPKITSLKELVPFAFLEAVKVKNFSLARSYLTDELNDALEDEHLESYFGEYVEIAKAEYEQDCTNKIAIVQENKKRQAKIFEVLFAKNKISNFSES